jgi:DNA topoisomerase-1
VHLLETTLIRVGNDDYARENKSYGLTTLRDRHVEVDGAELRFEYRGKGRIRQCQLVHQKDIVRLIERQLRTPGPRLFSYRSDGAWRVLTARDVNEYLKRRIGPYSAKDFRTWGGTLRAATVLAELGPAGSETAAKRNVALAMRLVSSELGNTPTICRKSYVHPIVIARYLDEGETIPLPRARRAATDRGRAHSPEERALIAFLDRHFPERRKKPRTEQRTRRKAA